MGYGSSLRAVAPLILATIAQVNAAELQVNKADLTHLRNLRTNEQSAIDGFPVGPAHNATVRFRRVEVYAADAHIYALGNNSREEIPRSQLVFLRGQTQDGSARVALALNPDGSFA